LQRDVENLENLFKTLNIETKVLRDLPRNELIMEAKLFRDDSFQDASMSVFVVMAHGDDNSEIYSADELTLNTEYIIDLFDDKSCPNLKGKPKWFIFQVIEKIISGPHEN